MLLTKTTVTRFEKRVNMLNDKLNQLATDFGELNKELQGTVFEDILYELATSSNTVSAAFEPVVHYINELNSELNKLYK